MQEVVAVDIGNSGIKLAVAANAPVIRINASEDAQSRSAAVRQFASGLTRPVQWLVCSVDRVQCSWLEQQVSELRPMDEFRPIAASDIELESVVDDRETLGRDRLLAAWFAWTQNEESPNSIIVDAGTAVTIDVVANGCHQGGLIFPSANTCLSAVSALTDALPDLTKSPVPTLCSEVQLGKSTQPAIILGVHQVQLFGIVSMVQSLQQQFSGSRIYSCGGAIEPLEQLLPSDWVYRADFLIAAIFQLKSHL